MRTSHWLSGALTAVAITLLAGAATPAHASAHTTAYAQEPPEQDTPDTASDPGFIPAPPEAKPGTVEPAPKETKEEAKARRAAAAAAKKKAAAEERAAKKAERAAAKKKAAEERAAKRAATAEALRAKKKAAAEERARKKAERAAAKKKAAQDRAFQRAEKEKARRERKDAAIKAKAKAAAEVKAAREAELLAEAAAVEKAAAEKAATEKAAVEKAAAEKARQDAESRVQRETASRRIDAMAMALRETISVDETRIANASREMVAVGAHGEAGLIDLLTDPVAPVRRAAGRAIGSLKLESALPHLIAALNDEDSTVVLDLVGALTNFDGLWPIEALVRRLGHPDPQVVKAAMTGLDRLDRQEIQRVIRRQLANPPVSTGPGPYLAALGRYPDASTVRDLYAALSGDKVAPHVLRGLAFLGDKQARGLAKWMVKEARAHPDTAAAGARVLVGYGRKGKAALAGVLHRLPAAVKQAAVEALVAQDSDQGAARLTDLTGHRSAELRIVALGLLNGVEGADARPHIESNLAHSDKRVRELVADVVGERGRDQVIERAVINRYRDLARRRSKVNREERNRLIATLGRVGKDQGVSELIQAIGQDDEMQVAMRSLGASGGRAVGALLFVIKTGDPVRTPLAVAALAEAGTEALGPLLKLLVHRSRDVRYTARKAVAEMGITEAVPAIAELINAPSTPGRAQLLALLGHLWCPDSFEALDTAARSHHDHDMRLAAVRVLSQQTGRQALQTLRAVARTDGNNEVRHLAIQALIWQGDKASVPTFLRMLATERDFIRFTLAQGLGYMAGPAVIPELIERMDTPRNDIIAAIRDTIRRISYRADLKTNAQFADWHDDWEDRRPPPPMGLQASHLTLGDGTQMHYWIGGQGDPLLILHDGPDLTHEYIVQYFSTLARDFTLLFVDLPGRGRSSRPTDGKSQLGVEHDAQSVATLLVRINLRGIRVYGHGWGGFVAVRLADKYPKLVSKIVLDNVPEPTLAGWSSLADISAGRVPHPWSEDLALFTASRQGFNPAVRDQFMTVALMTGGLGRPSVLLDVAPLLGRDPALRRTILGAMGDFDLRPVFDRIAKPTLLLYGTKSPLTEEAIAWRDRLDSENGNVSKFVLVGTGYLPGYEYPGPWAKLIRQFLR